MKKHVLSAAAVGVLAISSFGQGVIYFDGSNNSSTSPDATSEGEVFIGSGFGLPVLDTNQDINAELVYGTTASDVNLNNVVVTLLLSSSNITGNSTLGETLSATGDITDFASGVLFDASGTAYQFPTIAPGTTVYFDVYAWIGDYSSLAAAASAGTLWTTSGVFSEVLASPTGEANDIENMPALDFQLVPEPTTMNLAGLGSLSLLFMRRKR